MSNSKSPFRIIIVGGGASGSLVATHLLRQARRPLQIILIERQSEVGRGVAYGTRCLQHFLNVPAGRMSVFPDEPDHFLRWLHLNHGRPGVPEKIEPSAFVPRFLYGHYIRDTLADARAKAAPHVGLAEIRADAIDLEETPDELIVHSSDGRLFHGDRVVLAVGNLPGSYPIPKPLPVYRDPRYVHTPWNAAALDGIGPDDEVLLVGQGLTAADFIVQLAERGHRGTIHALSRHGIRPHAHRADVGTWSIPANPPIPPTTRAWVRFIREEIARASSQGVDWRAVVDAVRPHAQKVWQSLSWDERARFMRHVRPFWEAHRHRLAPVTAKLIEQLASEGRVVFYAGRLQVLEADSQGVQALLRHRGSLRHQALRVAKVINCTGPRTDYSKYQHPLFIHLLARGLIDHDPLALGISALPNGEVLRYRGESTARIFTLGAPMKGVLWESTAIPEIRQQAPELAKLLLSSTTAAQPPATMSTNS